MSLAQQGRLRLDNSQSVKALAVLTSVRIADRPSEGARELLETPYVCYFARLNAMTAQLEPAAEIHWS